MPGFIHLTSNKRYVGFASESRRIHHGDPSMSMFFQISGFELKCFEFLQNSENFLISAAHSS
jgi:hypothetical protein